MEQKESGFYETKKERGGDDVVGRKGQKAEKGVTLDELRFLFLKGIWKLEWIWHVRPGTSPDRVPKHGIHGEPSNPNPLS